LPHENQSRTINGRGVSRAADIPAEFTIVRKSRKEFTQPEQLKKKPRPAVFAGRGFFHTIL
jgi:hypothetical protein